MSSFKVLLFAALASHYHFRNHEPRASLVLFGLAAASVAGTLVQSAGYDVPLSIAFVKTCLLISAYLVLLSLSIISYRLSPWHPLAKFPGPKVASITKWWMVQRILFNGGRHTDLERLHAKYGPWLRVGPNEISVNCAGAVRSIYKLDRASFYAGTPSKGDALITVVDRSIHSRRRQAWTHAVTGSVVDSYVPLAQRRADQLVSIFRRESKSGSPLNLDKWVNLFFLDLMGDMGFSGGFETMKEGEDKEGWLDILAKGVIAVSVVGQVPWLKGILGLLPNPGPLATFHKFTQKKVDEIKARKGDDSQRDILGTLLSPADDSYVLTADEAAAEATLVVVAATDTSVQTILTFLRYVAVDEAVKQRLRNEVESVLGNKDEEDIRSVLQLPYLDACLQEALRIMPPGPFGPPRSSGIAGTLVEGVWVPRNTTLHMPVYAMQRDDANFGLGHCYIPERWLDDSDTRKNEEVKLLPFNREAFVPFSAGYSSCIGKPVALQNMKILLANIVQAFDFKPSPSFDLTRFDQSYKEYGLWTHEPLELIFESR